VIEECETGARRNK